MKKIVFWLAGGLAAFVLASLVLPSVLFSERGTGNGFGMYPDCFETGYKNDGLKQCAFPPIPKDVGAYDSCSLEVRSRGWKEVSGFCGQICPRDYTVINASQVCGFSLTRFVSLNTLAALFVVRSAFSELFEAINGGPYEDLVMSASVLVVFVVCYALFVAHRIRKKRSEKDSNPPKQPLAK